MIRSVPQMGTIVTVQLVGPTSNPSERVRQELGIERALRWFQRVEEVCSRFDPESELLRLTSHVREPVQVTELLFEAIQFALQVATESGGAFDPTMGMEMERRGFNREYRTGRARQTTLGSEGPVSFRDIHLDRGRKTVMLLRPLVLDLGAVAKGLAIDLAARELQAFKDFAIDAGGDLYLGGSNTGGGPWTVGIRHPRRDRELTDAIQVSNAAVCTSGDYERRSPNAELGHHILDPRTGASTNGVSSVTVVAPTAMAADALATAAFVLGPKAGIEFLERQSVAGLIITTELERHSTGEIFSSFLPDLLEPANDC